MRNKLIGGAVMALCAGTVACSGGDTLPSDPAELVAQYFDVTNTALPSETYARDTVESLTENFGPDSVFVPLSKRPFNQAEISAEVERAFAPGAERMDARTVEFVSGNLTPEQVEGVRAAMREADQLSIMRCVNDQIAATGDLDLNTCQTEIGSELTEESAAAMNNVVRQLRLSEKDDEVLVYFGSAYCTAQNELADQSSTENFTFAVEEAKLTLSDGSERTCVQMISQREAYDAKNGMTEDGADAEAQAAS